MIRLYHVNCSMYSRRGSCSSSSSSSGSSATEVVPLGLNLMLSPSSCLRMFNLLHRKWYRGWLIEAHCGVGGVGERPSPAGGRMLPGSFRCGGRRRQAHTAWRGTALPEEVAVRLHAGLVREAVDVPMLVVIPEPAPLGAGRAAISPAGQKARLVLRAVRLGVVRRRHRRGEDAGMSVEDGLCAGGAVFAVLARRRPRSGGGCCASYASNASTASTAKQVLILQRG